MSENLADKILFAKEAADYLGISTQRLSVLVREGKIHPFKKSSSGTLFLLEDLEARKQELRIFSKNDAVVHHDDTFSFDNSNKIEALNYSVLLNVLQITEKRLEPQFQIFEKKYPVNQFIDKKSLHICSSFFHFDEDDFLKEYEIAKKQFSNLKSSDEIIKRGDEDYPYLLSLTEQAPRFLYIRGNKALLQEKRTVSLVGSRTASQESKENTYRLAHTLGKNGITVISGLARGIDVSAHRSALDYGFNTIAVIGTNLNQYYPLENKEVQIEIEKKGLVISQFSPANKTQRWFFPLRNGVMSGLSLATIIMEAGETSGALKQADFAIKQNRLVIIPQKALENTNITWPEKYVKKGAKVVRKPKEVLEILANNDIFLTSSDKNQQLSIDVALEDEPHKTSWINLDSTEGDQSVEVK